jgi:1,6-anhydro-N-acetylmuramate kinase
MSEPTRRVIGCMTGTSLDGIDAASVDVVGRGRGLRVTRIEHRAGELGTAADLLRRLAAGQPATAGQIAAAALAFGHAHADLAHDLAARGDRPIALVAAHGQTVHHNPPASWQLLNPWPIAARLGCPVVTDLRGADLAAGGQGAPITPLSDWLMFRDDAVDRVVVNLGGFCNVTTLPAGRGPDAVRGGDVCVCNQLLDAAARRLLGRPYDPEGRAASRGTPDPAGDALTDRLTDQHRQGRSLGSGDEMFDWLDDHAGRLAPDDLLATLARAVGTAIGRAIERVAPGAEVLLAGGGARHAGVVAAMRAAVGRAVATTEAWGVAIDAREAAAMAVLGVVAMDGEPITLPGVTGAGRADQPVPSAGLWIQPPR